MSCSKVNILYYILLQYVPTTIMFLIIIVFRVSIVSAPMAHYVLYCNVLMLSLKSVAGFYIVSAITNTYALVLIGIYLTSISLLTFDPLIFVSPPLCISESISEIYIPVLTLWQPCTHSLSCCSLTSVLNYTLGISNPLFHCGDSLKVIMRCSSGHGILTNL